MYYCTYDVNKYHKIDIDQKSYTKEYILYDSIQSLKKENVNLWYLDIRIVVTFGEEGRD